MPIIIDKKVVDYRIAEPEVVKDNPDIVHMDESVRRPQTLSGTTYKLSTPNNVSEHALYITINDIVLNAGTAHELHRPFEIFINSKNMNHFQWIVALTRIISAVFRKGGDVTFLVEELRSVFDPNGGYWKQGGGGYVPSLVAEIGDVIEHHLIHIGLIKPPEPDPHQRELIDKKREQFELVSPDEKIDQSDQALSNASMCQRCHVKSVVMLDGCMTCLNCGDSKCG